jgi:hypothetical protein
VAAASAVPHPTPVFQSIGEHVLYWNLPLWFFAALYSALFAFVAFLWFAVPPKRYLSRAYSGGRGIGGDGNLRSSS